MLFDSGIDEGIDAGRDYVSQYEDGGKEFSRVAVDLGRLLILNVDRPVGMLAQAAKESGSPMTAAQRLGEQIYYLQEVVDLANSALAAGDLSQAQQCRARVVLGDALLKCRKQKEAAAQFGEALKLDTSEIDVDELRIKEVEALELAEDYEAMVKAGMNCLENHPHSPTADFSIDFVGANSIEPGDFVEGPRFGRRIRWIRFKLLDHCDGCEQVFNFIFKFRVLSLIIRDRRMFPCPEPIGEMINDLFKYFRFTLRIVRRVSYHCVPLQFP